MKALMERQRNVMDEINDSITAINSNSIPGEKDRLIGILSGLMCAYCSTKDLENISRYLKTLVKNQFDG